MSGTATNRTNITLPADVSNEILQKVQHESAIMQLARRIPLPGRGLSIPTITADPEAETLTDTLHGLRYAPRYELWLYDNDEMIAVNRGYLFDLAGDMYFIPAGDIPISALDENGQILPREGVTVTLYRVPDDWQQDSYNAVYRASTHYLWGVESEAGSGNNTLTGDPAPVEFVYFTIAILGIAVPIAPLVLGLCLPHSAKQGHKKRWYLLTIFGGAWMLLGILVLVMMIVAL